MRRLIASRPVRLALAVALVAGVAAGLVVAARRRRTGATAPHSAPPAPPAPHRAPPRDAEDPAGRGPEPVLGWPTSEDLERYDRPEAAAPIVRLLGGLPRIERPRGRKARRWTAALVALGLLVLTSQLLENAVFRPGAETASGRAAYAGGYAEPAPAVPSADPVADVPVAQPPLPSRDPACALRKTGSTTPAVRPISRRVTAAVNRQWRRIEKWLKAHAPRTYASLNKPAGRGLVAKAEARLGMRIPDSLRASLLRHNGARGPAAFRFSSHYAIMGARGLVSSWPETCEMGGGIPFAYDSDFGDYLVTNSATGGVGSADWELPYYEDEWSSYYALLTATADALAEGGPVGESVPVVHEGVLEWK
ncbi:SMI1/KNR4 family protein [Microbispora sp. CA-102843]|uniref:SMI1/KNR4 family protein n=1 Tax=Microbispora sp. CA-102843 TaxID=3239952 RepID=UPI003D93F376